MNHWPPYSGGRPPPAYGMQQGWSFTGPPPGHALPAHAGQVPHYGLRPAAGQAFPPQPQMHAAGQVPAGPMFHYGHSQFPPYGAPPQHFMPRPPQMQPHEAAAIHPRPPAQNKYVNKKEREKAKRERKEARKLAEQPVPIMTEDAQPRDFLNETERQETRDWIAERKARFPTKGNLAKKQEALAAVAQSGGSEGRSRCDEQLFTVLQEQHNRGLLRAAGTEDLFRNVSRRQRASGKRPPVAATDAAATTAAAATAAAPGAAQVADQGSEGTAVDMSAESGMAGAGCASAAAPAEAAAWPADGAGPAPASATQAGGAKRGPPAERTGPAPKRQNRQGWVREGSGATQRQPCLLHRLVAGDVRQDRNLLLQVIRFFVTNNYLQGVDVESLQFPEGASHES